MTQTTRRDFLKTSGAILAATSTLSIARGANAAGKEEIRVGLIGCGGRGNGAAAQVMSADPCVKLVAVGDYIKSRAENAAKYFRKEFSGQAPIGDESVFSGFDNYLNVIKSDVDLVLIACAAKFHPLYAKTALEAGKHVFVEKPHAIDAQGIHVIEEAIKIAEQKNLCLLSGLHSRHCRQNKALIGKIHDGLIGEVQVIQSSFLRAPYGVFQFRPEMSELDNQVYNQYHFRWLSGDDVTQSLVHNLDRMNWAIGDDELPEYCFGLGGRASMLSREYGDVFDHHTAVFVYPSGKRIYALCRTENGCYDEYDDLIIGSKGTAFWNASKITGETNWQYEGPADGGHQEEQTMLIETIKAGKTFRSGQHMADGSMMGVLGQVACYTGKKLPWKETYDSKFLFGPAPEDCKDGMEPPVVTDANGIFPVPIPGQCKFW